MRKLLFAVLLSFFICIQSSQAASRMNFAGVEKLFLEGKYDAVITQSDVLIKSGAARKDEIYYMKALSQLKLNRFADARASFEYIISNYRWSKNLFDVYMGLGDSHLLEGQASKALGVYNEMASKFPSDKNIAIVYSRMSSCYAKMGLSDKANYYANMAKREAPLSFEANSTPVAVKSVQETTRVSGTRPVHVQASSAVISGPGVYSVQVGSFKSKRNADKLCNKLSACGYESYIEIPVDSIDKLYRVKVGKLGSKEESERLAARLRASGYRTKTCTGDVCE